MEIINATDGYKLGHHRMYPEGTEQVYSNWTPRSNKYFPEDVNLDFLCHDFSMRGMAGLEAAIISGMAHMTSFVGTIPAIAALEEYYGANSDNELIAATVPATEHSVMCAGGEEDELQTFKRLINELYPSGFVSIVSDTWDFWNVIENFLPKLKKDIMARVVIRPDSGDPVDIICGLRTNPHFHTRMKERAWKKVTKF